MAVPTPAAARERLHSALGSPDAREALRTAAIDLAGAGLPREALVAAVSDLYDDRIEKGFEAEADALADLMDQLREWFDDGKAWF